MSHFTFTLLASMLLSAGFAFMGNRTLQERVYVAVYWLFCCAITTLAGSWAMHWIHG